MKKVFLITLLVSGLSFGQAFSTQNQAEDTNNGTSFFQNDTQGTTGNPGQGTEDGPGQPGDPLPINNWMLILPVIAIGIGFRYYRKQKELA